MENEIVDSEVLAEQEMIELLGEATWQKVKEGAKEAGHAVVAPFKAAYRIATVPSETEKFKTQMKGALKQEGKETKAMVKTFGKRLVGKKTSKEEKHAAWNQLIDLGKVAGAGALGAKMGIVKTAKAAVMPTDELVAVGVDKPLRKVTKKLFGHSHGLLPSAFYQDHSKNKTIKESIDSEFVIDFIVEYICEELTKIPVYELLEDTDESFLDIED